MLNLLPTTGRIPYPCRGSEESAGIDLGLMYSTVVKAGCSKKVDLGASFEIPAGYFGLLTHRSSLAFKKSCMMSLGIIDSDYRGVVSGLIINFGKEDQTFKSGDRVAQLVIQPYKHMKPVASEELKQTARGEQGFGSSGE